MSRALRTSGRWVLLAPIWVYRRLDLAALPASCRYYPSCSAYAEEAIKTPRRRSRRLAGRSPAGSVPPLDARGRRPRAGSPKAADADGDRHPSTVTGA